MKIRRYLQTGDSARVDNVDLTMILRADTDTYEFALYEPTDHNIIYEDPHTGKEHSVQWDDGIPFVEVDDGTGE